MKTTSKKLLTGLAISTMLTTAVKAELFTWESDSGQYPTLQPTSGTLDYSGGVLNSYSFSYDGWPNPDTSFPGTITVLGDGDLLLSGTSPGDANSPKVVWQGRSQGLGENYAVSYSVSPYPGGAVIGDWVPTPVPEPTTIVLLLLPFAASTLRILRKNRTM